MLRHTEAGDNLDKFSFRVVIDQSLIRRCQRAQEIAEIAGQRMQLKTDGVGGERTESI